MYYYCIDKMNVVEISLKLLRSQRITVLNSINTTAQKTCMYISNGKSIFWSFMFLTLMFIIEMRQLRWIPQETDS